MFIVTARIPRKKLLAGAITVFCCCLVLATALIVTAGDRAVTAAANTSAGRGNEDRIAYLKELGWEVRENPSMVEELMIPEEFDESYADYLALQEQQGFDLKKYTGKRIKRYLYDITNYTDTNINVQAALLVYKGKIIGGQLQAVDGSFVLPLSGT